jgi:5'-deoxynucleotidase YfbR-like HD superfamily hydrolase
VLLHDAPEYVIGDMISPFKAVIRGCHKAVEARLMAAIHLRFGLPATPRRTCSPSSRAPTAPLRYLKPRGWPAFPPPKPAAFIQAGRFKILQP